MNYTNNKIEHKEKKVKRDSRVRFVQFEFLFVIKTLLILREKLYETFDMNLLFYNFKNKLKFESNNN